MDKYDGIRKTLEQLCEFFDEFSLLEQKKLDAVTEGNIELLEEYMKQEQAQTMRLKGLDKHREQALTDAGMTNESFREMVKSPANAEQTQVAMVYSRLGDKLREYTDNSEVIKKQIELKLHGIKLVLERLESSPGVGIYNRSGEAADTEPAVFKPKKI